MRYKAMPLSTRASASEHLPGDSPNRASDSKRRPRDWIATLPILLLVPAIVIPLLVIQAATPTLTVAGTATPGHDVTVSGSNFDPGTKVRISWDGSIKRMPSGTASDTGTFDVVVSIPQSAKAGDHEIAASRGRAVLARIKVTIAGAAIAPDPLPTTGSAWTSLKSIADGSLGTPDLCNQDNKHDVRTLAVALVYARTGIASYYTKARDAIMSALPTIQVGCYNAVLSLGRQLGAYVLAADFIKLSGTDDVTFRSWLTTIRTLYLGGHGRWVTLTGTHEDSNNNWGAFAGASRIAASLYPGGTGAVARASLVVRGFLGDRYAYSGFRTSLYDNELTWTCSSSGSNYTP